MTDNQKKTYDFIVSYMQQNGRSPSYEEIMVSVGVHSKQRIFDYMNRLERYGYIKRIYGSSRAIQVVDEKEYIFLPTKHRMLKQEKYSKPMPTKNGYQQFVFLEPKGIIKSCN